MSIWDPSSTQIQNPPFTLIVNSGERMCPCASEMGISRGTQVRVATHHLQPPNRPTLARIRPIPIRAFQGTRRPITLFRHQRVVRFDVPEVTSAQSGETQQSPLSSTSETGRVRTFASRRGFRHAHKLA